MDKYNAEVKYDAFENANNMNTWVEDKTFGKIKNIVSDNIVKNEDIKMLLVNALAVDMETKSNYVSYYKDDNVTALAMDLKKYNDNQLEFIAIMPNKDLSNYIKKLTAAATTVVYMGVKTARFVKKPKPIYVSIDRPFMYLVKDKNTNEIWFVGTVYEPNH